jgi:hypothetical protein
MTNSASPTRVVISITDNDTTSCIVSLSETMPHADIRRMLARHFSANALKLRRLDRRDDVIRQLRQLYDLDSGRQIAEAINRDLHRYGASGFRVNKVPPADEKRGLLHRVLDLIGTGEIPGAGQIREILAGKRS